MGLYGVWNIQKIRGKIVMNSDERAKVIIEGFKKLTLEQMEQMLKAVPGKRYKICKRRTVRERRLR